VHAVRQVGGIRAEFGWAREEEERGRGATRAGVGRGKAVTFAASRCSPLWQHDSSPVIHLHVRCEAGAMRGVRGGKRRA